MAPYGHLSHKVLFTFLDVKTFLIRSVVLSSQMNHCPHKILRVLHTILNRAVSWEFESCVRLLVSGAGLSFPKQTELLVLMLNISDNLFLNPICKFSFRFFIVGFRKQRKNKSLAIKSSNRSAE